jgi:hypothetical protein
MSPSWLRVLGLIVVSAWLAVGCSDAKKIAVGGACVLNSDCHQPLVCTMDKCHDACHTSADCPLGQSCITASDQSKVCQLPSEKRCTYSSDCPPSLKCATDRQCRNQCQGNADCVDGQICTTTNSCAELNQTDPRGNLIGPDGGVSGSVGDSAAGRTDGCPVGIENCSCYTDDTCTAGLSCAAGVCVSSGVDGAAGTDGSSSLRPDAAVDRPADLSSGRDGALDAAVLVGGLTVDSPTLNFGSVDQGTMSTKTITVTNTGLPAAVSPQVTGNGFFVSSTTCMTVSTNGTCTITVAFSPGMDASGGVSGTLTVATGIAIALSATVTPGGTFLAALSTLPATALAGQAVPLTVTVTATGALVDLACLNSGPDLTADPIAANTTCTASVAANVPCVYSFVFRATTAGVATDKISCSAGGKIRDLPVSLTVLSPASLSISPTPAAFAAVVGTTSEPIYFTVRNSGTAPSGVLSAVLGGTGAAQFAMQSNACSGVLSGGATCLIQVVFRPTAAGAATASLTVSDAAAVAGSTPAVAVANGGAIPPSALAIAGPPDLGTATVGQASAASTFTLTNSGGTTSDLVRVAVTDAQFTVGNDLCAGLPLAAGGTCTFAVTFAPTSAGVKTTLLAVSSGVPVVAQKQIQGTGVVAKAPTLSLSPPTLDFGTIGVGTTAGPKAFTVTNTGDTATGVLNVVKTDSTSSVGGAAQFTYTSACAPALAPGATCTVSVTFAPTISGGASAIIRVSDGVVATPSDAGTVLGIALVPSPIAVAGCDSNATSWRTGALETFADTVVGKTSPPLVCTLTNGSSSVQATGAITIVTTGDFAVPAATNNCTASLAPGLSCTFSLTFSPTATGQRDGIVTVTTDSRGGGNLLLSGVGLGVVEIVEIEPCGVGGACFDPNNPSTLAANAVTAEPYDFGPTPVGTRSTTALTLAVFVRASVGNLGVTTDFGSPDAFLVGDGTGGTHDGSAILGGIDCSFYATNPTPTSGFQNQTPLCYKIVYFTPKARNTQNGTITVAGASPQSDRATVTGAGTGPLTVTPTPATFSNVAQGTASNTLTLTIRNNGAVALGSMTYSKTGSNADQFSIVNDALTGATIAAGSYTTIGVKFIPTALGGATASITVSGVLAGGSGIEAQTVNLVGNGVPGSSMTVTISNGGGFADTGAGAWSAPATVTVTNAAGSSVTGHVDFSIEGGGDFTMSPPVTTPPTLQGTCAQAATNPVAGGASCTEFIWFNPDVHSAVLSRTATLVVTASPGGVFVLPLVGNALPQITITPAGTTAVPVDITASGLAVVASSSQPSVTFTVINNSAVDITGITLTVGSSANGPNMPALFAIDAGAGNACTAGTGVSRMGGTCTFKLNATSTDPAQLGTFFAQVKAAVVDNPAQVARAEVKGTVVTPAQLALTPATDIDGRDFGVVQLNHSSAPVKYTLVNTGGQSSGPIKNVDFYQTGGLVKQAKPTRFVVDATACAGEAGLAPGRTCDLNVTFNPTSADPNDAGLDLTADLVVPVTAGLASEIRRTVHGTATAAETAPYLVDDTSGLAPALLPVIAPDPNQTITRQIALHANGTPFVLPTSGTLATVTGTGMGSGTDETVTIAGGPAGSKPCVLGNTVAAPDTCTLVVTWTPGTTAPAPGWRVFTATIGGVSMNLFGRVGNAASLQVSRAAAGTQRLDFGDVMVGLESQHETVVVTNMGELATKGNLAVTAVPADGSIQTSGCTTASLPYLGSCTLDIWVVPGATGAQPSTSTVTVTANSGTVAAPAVNLSWFGTTAAALSVLGASAHDFGSQAVLSTGGTAFTFTFQNGVNAQKSGTLGVSVVDASGIVIPDFVVDPDPTHSTCLAVGALTRGVSCTVAVRLVPIALSPAAKAGTLTVRATPGGSATAALTGTAISP